MYHQCIIYFRLTNGQEFELKIDMTDENDVQAEAYYEHFEILDNTSYTLKVSGFDWENPYGLGDEFGMGNGFPFQANDSPCSQKYSTVGW